MGTRVGGHLAPALVVWLGDIVTARAQCSLSATSLSPSNYASLVCFFLCVWTSFLRLLCDKSSWSICDCSISKFRLQTVCILLPPRSEKKNWLLTFLWRTTSRNEAPSERLRARELRWLRRVLQVRRTLRNADAAITITNRCWCIFSFLQPGHHPSISQEETRGKCSVRFVCCMFYTAAFSYCVAWCEVYVLFFPSLRLSRNAAAIASTTVWWSCADLCRKPSRNRCVIYGRIGVILCSVVTGACPPILSWDCLAPRFPHRWVSGVVVRARVCKPRGCGFTQFPCDPTHLTPVVTFLLRVAIRYMCWVSQNFDLW